MITETKNLIQLTQRKASATFAAVVALVAALMLVLTGCSGGKETVTSYQLEQQGTITKLTFYATGDKVDRQTTETILNYEEVGFANKDEAEEYLAPVMEEFDQDIAGFSHSIEYGETEAVEKLEVNYAEADLDQISQLTGSQFDGDAQANGVSLEKTVEMLEARGFEKVE